MMKKILVPLFLLFSIRHASAALLFKAHDNTGETPLHFAARNNNREAAQFFLRQYWEMRNKKDNCGKTPLFVALSHGHIELAQLLMRAIHGEEAKIEPVAHETACDANPLHIMISLGIPHEIVRTLVDWVAQHPIVLGVKTKYIFDVNGEDSQGRTPLDLACVQGNQELIKLLIATECIDIHKKNKDSRTLLFRALMRSDFHLAELLLKADATRKNLVSTLSVRDQEGKTPIHIFAQTGNLESLCRLLHWHRTPEIPDLTADTVDHENKTPLYFAVMSNKPQTAEFLARTSSMSTLNAITPRRKTLFFIALAYGHLDIADMLYKAKILAELSEHDQDTPDHVHAAKIVLAYGFLDKNSIPFELQSCDELKDSSHITPIHVLAARNKFSLLDPVLNWIQACMQFDINTKDYQGQTPLFVALMNGSIEAASFLLEHGADPYMRPNNNNTPLHYLASNNEAESLERVLRWTRRHQIDYVGYQDDEGSTPVIIAASHGSFGLVAKFILALLGKQEILKLKNNEGKTALFIALACGYTDIADLLINMGADTSQIKDLEGRNPLHYLVEKKNVDGLERVLNWQNTKQLTHLAISDCDDHGASPLCFATFQPSDDYLPLLKKLIEHDAVRELPLPWHTCIERDARAGKLIEARQTLLTAYLSVIFAHQSIEE